MPKARDNRLRIFPDRQAAAEAAEECRTERFPKVVPDTLAGGPNVAAATPTAAAASPRPGYARTGASASSTPATGDTAAPWGAPRRHRPRGARRWQVRKDTR